ncbi:dispersed gene family protein 1 (DGF-1), partial [Trypanosoma cruzi]
SSFQIYYNSWLQLSGNLCRESPSEAFAYISPTVSLRDSMVSVSGNQLMSSTVTPTVLRIPKRSRDLTNGAIVAACNTVNGEEGAKYSIPSVYNATILTCSDPCTLAASCFPAYTTTASSDGCACTCAEDGHGDACLPVAVAEPPSTDGADLCVRDVHVDEEVSAGFGTSVACYVGVTFAADVVVDVASMSGSVRNVTLANCTFVDGASLYVVGWRSDPPAGERADVLISGLESRSGGGVLVSNRYPPGSRVTVVDSVLIAEKRVAYRGAYGLGDASACLVLHNVNLTGSVLTIARTQVVAVFGDAVGVLVFGGVALSSRGALYVDGLSVQTALGLCVSVEGGVAASGGSVVAFVDSDFLLCKHAVCVRGAVSVSGSAVAFLRSEFLSTGGYAVAFYSTVGLGGGSMLLAKGNVHDGVSREMLYAAGAVTAAGSTLSFVRNRALLPRMLSLSLALSAGAHLRVACNDAGGRVLSTAEEYAAAGFGDAGSIDVAGCDACDRDTHCYAPGTASASMRNGVCFCACGSGGYGEACVPVGAPALPPAVGTASSVFVREGVTVRSVFVVPAGASEVTLRHVVLDGVSPVLYVPWMARDGVRIVVQNVSLLNGAVLYVMGGGALRGAWAAMRFPSLTYVVAHAMHLGIFFGSVLALAMHGSRVWHRVIGVVGVLYGVAFPAGVCCFIARHTGASFTRYWQFSRKPLHERLLYPVGYWHPAAQQRMYGGMLTNMRGSHVYWCVFQLLVLCVVCLIAAVHPPVGDCHVQYFCMAAVLLAGAGVVAFTKMMRSVFLTVMQTAGFVLLGVLCLVSAANHIAPSDGGARAYAAIALLLTTVVFAVTVYGVVVWYAEDRHWQELREPRRGVLEALLRDDEHGDEETQNPHDTTSSSYASGTTVASSYRPPAVLLQPMAGDTRSDALSLLDRASNAGCKVDCFTPEKY